jgi:P27 family predicted phage terminase small subunit
MRGRKPKPAYLKLLQGNPGGRAVKDELKPTKSVQLPDPPEILTTDAREEWLRIVEEAYNLGLLTVVDTQSLAAYCQAYGRWIVAERALAKLAAIDPNTGGLMIKSKNSQPMANPLLWIAANAARDMVRYASEFGFTPASRTRIAAGHPPHIDSKFGGLLG